SSTVAAFRGAAPWRPSPFPPTSLPALAGSSTPRTRRFRRLAMPAHPPTPSAEADLAFMRSIVQGGGRASFTLAVCYLAGGLLYGLQCLFHLGQAFGVVRWPDLANLAFAAAVTIAFLAALVCAIRRDRRDAAPG